MHHIRVEGLLLRGQLLSMLLLLVELLLLDGGFELVFVLQRLPLHLLLPLDALFVRLAARLPHLLLLLELVSVALQFKLHLVFSLALLHLLIILYCLTLLFFHDLGLLHGEFSVDKRKPCECQTQRKGGLATKDHRCATTRA